MSKDETKEDRKEKILDELKEVHRAAVIGKSLDSKIVGNEAHDEFEKYGKKVLFEYIVPGSDKPQSTKEQYEAMNEKDQDQALKAAFERRQLGALETILKEFKDNSEEIFKIDGKYDPKLSSIGNDREIVENTPDKYHKFAELHREYLAYKKMVNDIKDGKEVRIEDKEQRMQLASAAAAKAEYDNMKKKGWSDKFAELSAKIAGLVGGVDNKHPNVEEGAKYIMKEIEKRMKLKDGENVEQRASEYVSAALNKMITSGDAKREVEAVTLYHLAQKGYKIGDKKFDEVFKKDKK